MSSDLTKLVKQKLSDDLIISFNEPIVSLISVQNPKKKAKEDHKYNYLIATSKRNRIILLIFYKHLFIRQ